MIRRILPAALLATLVAVAPAAADVAIYSDALAAGWQDWSWGGVTRDYARPAPVHGGAAAIGVTFTGGWSGLQLGRNDAVDPTGNDVLRCWLHGGSSGGQSIEVRVGNHLTGAYATRSLTLAAATWTRVDVPLADAGGAPITYVYWFNATAGAQSSFTVDDVAFVASGAPTPTPPPPAGGPALRIDAAAGRHPISPYIYGLNFPDEGLAAELRLPVARWGGNSTTRYNWRTDTSNRASDWYFENIPNDNSNPGALPAGSSSDRFVEQNRRTGTETLLTMPLIGWTPHGRAVGCGFSVARYGAQQSTDPWQPDCGNGIRANGTEITGNDPADVSDAIDPTFVRDWMLHLNGRYGTPGAGGVRFFNLDNEPMLWPDTHRDVHPQPIGYDELRNRTIQYAAAIKAVDAAAQTLGPAEWGWSGYFWSSLDSAPGGDWWNHPQDRLAHGNVPLVEWYLQQLRAYEQQQGVRLLDYLDLHYYPQASGVALSPAGSVTTQTLRLRSTRALWDPSYVDESWIGEAVQLIPRMRDWVARNYPGTKLAIGEYNWGALDHLNGALAQADVLGIFGREQLDLATLWDPPSPSQPVAYAFRVFRNYDGAGGAFGDVAVAANSDDQARVAVYAAERTSDGALIAVVINKSTAPQTSQVTFANRTLPASATVYRYSAANLGAIVRAPDQALTGSGFSATFPASSISLLVVAAAGAPSAPTATPTATRPPPTATVTASATRTFSATPTRTFTATPTVTPPAGPTYRVAGGIRSRANQPVAGASVELQGAAPRSATSAADGAYAFAGVPAGSWQIAPRKLGAGNGAISALDAAWVLQAVAGTRTLDPLQALAGDVTGDGTLSALDATRILQMVVGLRSQLPAAAVCQSDWLFIPAPSGTGQSVPPALTGSTCQPGAIGLAPLAADAEAQNFTAVLIGDVSGSWQPAP